MSAISSRPSTAISNDLLQQKEDQNEKDLQRIMSLSKRELKELSKHCMICLSDIGDGTCLYPNCCQGRRVMTRHALNTGKASSLPIIRKVSFDDSKSKEWNKKRSISFSRSISPIASLRSLVNSLRNSHEKSPKSNTLKKSDDGSHSLTRSQ
ncbi:predicted protein [Chaetoceros tenuissimus]|uniref:Uncharacterized protein n=1 Tax=Chaetoceros tenuissimus TaxID=426638 RepID=A0AAD3CUT2_9STRA|nr:predicted protein [Chaetoceros tenuissimus]